MLATAAQVDIDAQPLGDHGALHEAPDDDASHGPRDVRDGWLPAVATSPVADDRAA